MAKSQHTGMVIAGAAVAAAVVGGILVARRLKRVPFATGRINILDVPVDPLTMEEALARIEEYIRSGRPHHIFTADASGIMRAQEDPALHAIVTLADLVTPDGSGVLLASRINGAALPERVSGVDLVEHISAMAAERGYAIYLFGAVEGTAQAAAEALQGRYPGLKVAGVRNGYFTGDEEAKIVEEIAAAKPDALFVALGIPKQEIFIRKHFEALGVPVMIGVGGSFDVVSGRLKRAPAWMQRTGLEWLYRFLQEPSRLPRLAALPQFVFASWRSRKRPRPDNSR